MRGKISQARLVVLMLVAIVIAMPPPMVMIAPMALVVVLVVPMSFVPFPAFAIVVVVRMRPVGPFKGRTLPMSPHPLVTVAHRCPISFDPYEPRFGRRTRLFVNDSRWRGPNVHRNLR